jgi:hypothetical protein
VDTLFCHEHIVNTHSSGFQSSNNYNNLYDKDWDLGICLKLSYLPINLSFPPSMYLPTKPTIKTYHSLLQTYSIHPYKLTEMFNKLDPYFLVIWNLIVNLSWEMWTITEVFSYLDLFYWPSGGTCLHSSHVSFYFYFIY